MMTIYEDLCLIALDDEKGNSPLLGWAIRIYNLVNMGRVYILRKTRRS
jgi:hypothetical protein